MAPTILYALVGYIIYLGRGRLDKDWVGQILTIVCLDVGWTRSETLFAIEIMEWV